MTTPTPDLDQAATDLKQARRPDPRQEVRMTTQLPISPLQFDLATAVARMDQAHELGPDSPGGGHLVDRLLECDLPRLRGHLDAAGRALIAAADGDGPLPVRLHPPAGEVEPSPEWAAKVAALPDGSVAGALAEVAPGQAPADLAEADLRGVYRERASLVAHLAAVYPSHIGLSDPATPEWPVVTVETPANQMTWHIAPEDRDLFGHVQPTPQFARGWDGHSTEEKYRRLAELTGRESGRGDQRRSFVPAMLGDLDQLTASVARVRALHARLDLYEACGHDDHADGTEVVLVDGRESCRTTPVVTVCGHCCAPAGHLTLDHEESHDPVDCWPCPTRRAVEQP